MKRILLLLAITFISLPAAERPPQPPKGRKLPTFGQIVEQEEQKQKQEKRKQERAQEKERQEKEKYTKEGLLEVLPAELRLEILKSLVGSNLKETLANIKRYYLAHPASQKSFETTKEILTYLIKKRFIRSANELQYSIDELKKLPAMVVFKNPEMISWIKSHWLRFEDEMILIKGACSGNEQIVKGMLARHIDVNAQDTQGDTALTYAIISGIPEIVEILLKAGANPNSINENGNTPILLILVKIFLEGFTPGNKKILTLLLEHGANPNVTLREFPIMNLFNINFENLEIGEPFNVNLPLPFPLTEEQRTELLDLLRKHGLKE